ncbi:GNAT family N-acetyltransferase [Leptolyngbya sp. FACHB-261]|uniref:GNAT family N-acetyltransferase n=1 Tax=Leptolyngbya sp. FACHB-261 TaxID=2692806 RepID=UPI001681FA21|nr:GNAT family N-acetyltransferase [Leptolyngbya sp. FACHB-261]MBD2105187.1 GNAT family N-acetyltransferase [Leptolyngbya sp. FACHB-261]
MQANFTIRTAKPEDRLILITLMKLLQDAERELCLNRTLGSEIGDAHLAYLEELAGKQNGQIYVAESKEDILGFVVCFVEKLDEGDLHVVESEREYGYISDLYVVPVMRKHGVGAELMQAAERHFLDLDLEVVRVGLLCSNEPAAKFYQKAGYRPYEIFYKKHLNE